MKKSLVSIAALMVLAGAGCAGTKPVEPVTTQNQPTPAPVAEQQPTAAPENTQNAPQATVKTFTMAEVQAANNQDKCWTVVRGKVYDLTPFTPKHPGGDKAVLGLCGKDGTSAFERQHGGQSQQEMTLTSMEIGTLAQ